MDSMNMLGAVGETAVALEFVKLGVPVYLPVADVGADMIADFGERPQKIQVKTYSGADITHRFILRTRTRHGWVDYEPGTVDWYALHFTQHGFTALIPADIGQPTVKLTVGGGRKHPADEVELSRVVKSRMEDS